MTASRLHWDPDFLNCIKNQHRTETLSNFESLTLALYVAHSISVLQAGMENVRGKMPPVRPVGLSSLLLGLSEDSTALELLGTIASSNRQKGKDIFYIAPPPL